MLVFIDWDLLINDEIWGGGTICISIPRSKFLGDASLRFRDLCPCFGPVNCGWFVHWRGSCVYGQWWRPRLAVAVSDMQGCQLEHVIVCVCGGWTGMTTSTATAHESLILSSSSTARTIRDHRPLTDSPVSACLLPTDFHTLSTPILSSQTSCLHRPRDVFFNHLVICW